LFLLNKGDSVYEEIIFSERHVIEDIIKQVAKVDIIIKGFVKEDVSDDKPESQRENKDEELSNEEFGRKVIDLFGKDNVTFIE